MGKNFRCPLCGSTVSPTRLDNSYSIDIYSMHGLGKGRGFSFEKIEDLSLVELVKDKIRELYLRFKLFVWVAPKLKIKTDPMTKILVDSGASVAETPLVRAHVTPRVNTIFKEVIRHG